MSRRKRGGRCAVEYHTGERTGEVGGRQGFHRDTSGGGVHEQPAFTGGQQQQAVGHTAEYKPRDTGHRLAVDAQIGRQREPRGPGTGHECLQHDRIVDDQRRQRGWGHRAGDQGGRGLVDHCAQIGHRRSGPAEFLGDRHTE
jgi:hypothetical protein